MSLQDFFNSITGNGVNKKNADGETRLYQAARAGSLSEVRKLIKSGADVNLRNAQGLTPLHQAAYWGETGIMKALLDAGADPSSATADGWTPLHSAALAGGARSRGDVIALLKTHGASDATPDKHGWTAADYMQLWEDNAEAAARIKTMIAEALGKKAPPADKAAGKSGQDKKLPNILKPFFPHH